MTIVIDIGCAQHGADYSIERLIDEFKPAVLYGFDPNEKTRTDTIDGCAVAVWRKAAWTHYGRVAFHEAGLASAVDVNGGRTVAAVDLAAFIFDLDVDGIVLKCDAEGAEYLLLEHLIETGADRQLSLAIVEWHQADDGLRRRRRIEQRIACEIREWPW